MILAEMETPIFLGLVRSYLEQNPTGGSLHIAFDDGNWKRPDIEFCLGYALKRNDYAGAFIASMLLQLTDEALGYLATKSESLEDVVTLHAMGV